MAAYPICCCKEIMSIFDTLTLLICLFVSYEKMVAKSITNQKKYVLLKFRNR